MILLDRLLLRRVLREEVGGAVSLCIGSKSTQDFILGNFLPSLPGLDRFPEATQHCVLGYYRPSLRDWFRYLRRPSSTPSASWCFQANISIEPSKKLIWTSLTLVRPLRDLMPCGAEILVTSFGSVTTQTPSGLSSSGRALTHTVTDRTLQGDEFSAASFSYL